MAVELQGNFGVIYESIKSEDKRFSILQERDKNREDEPHYTDKLYGGYFTYNQMVAHAKKEYDYGYETNFLTYMKNWWKENYIRLSGELD